MTNTIHNHPKTKPLGDVISVESMLDATRGFARAMFCSDWMYGLYGTMRLAYYQWVDREPFSFQKGITENTFLVIELADCFAKKERVDDQ